MARKSIKGYAEKNYYDNTRFNGGIIASYDTLNEGYFKHLVNFDIADTGQSITPRKGFLTTTFKLDDNIIKFDNNTIYYYDVNTGKYIFFKLQNKERKAYKCTFDELKHNMLTFNELEHNMFTDIKEIKNFDTSDIGSSISYITPIYTNQAIRIVDEHNVTAYVIKVKIDAKYFGFSEVWLKLYYRETGSGIYANNTLVVSYLNTDELVNYVDTNFRNIASSKSIIPDPLQYIYDDPPLGHYDRMPMIYIRADNNYYINEIPMTLNNFEVIPNFYVSDTDTRYSWAFTYEIVSTNRDLKYDENIMYKSPVYSLESGMVGTMIADTPSMFLDLLYASSTAKNNYFDMGFGSLVHGINKNYNLSVYTDYIESLSVNTFNDDNNEYVVYIMPRPTKEANIDLSVGSGYLGPYGLFTYFSDTVYVYNGDNGREDVNAASIHNSYVRSPSALMQNASIYNFKSINLPSASSSMEEALDYMIRQFGNYEMCFYAQKLGGPSIFSSTEGGYKDCIETQLSSHIFTWRVIEGNFEDSGDVPIPVYNFKNSEMYNTLKKANKIIFKPLNISCYVNTSIMHDIDKTLMLSRLFPGITTTYTEGDEPQKYFVAFESYGNAFGMDSAYSERTIPNTCISWDGSESRLNQEIWHNSNGGWSSSVYHWLFFSEYEEDGGIKYPGYTLYPLLDITTTRAYTRYTGELFTFNHRDVKLHIKGDGFNLENSLYKKLYDDHYFDQGLIINMYLSYIPNSSHDDYQSMYFTHDEVITKYATLTQTRQVSRTTQDPTKYILQLTDEPKWIADAKGSLSYTSLLGSHLVLYTDNKLFISKEGMQHYFTYSNMFEYPEEIVKVIQYKEMLLVFTRQNLYAVYLEEVVTNVANGTNEDGSIKYVQQYSYEFRTQCVLYNLMVDEKYSDAIQVYNQMVLFYSSDGQMFLIKPTAAVDSETRFSTQYFNKNANDILLNYKDYMQQRLQYYGINDIIEDVEIKVSATLNYIKIFYSAPDLITYILVYDILNNRYYVYDTLAFTKVKYLHYIPSGEMYITEYEPKNGGENELYFTIPYADPNITDNNVDRSYYHMFSPFPVKAELDTGTLNLNNHLKKRFKDLHVIYKNLSANGVEFSLETFVDDVPVITYIDTNFEIRNISGFDTLVTTETVNAVQLIQKPYESHKVVQLVQKPTEQLISQTALLSFADYTSNKIITHKTNIVSKGKTIRIKMHFNSKGKYKIQGFGLIYKEHTV